MNIREKKHRLPEAAYRGVKTTAFTACIEDRQRPFVVPGITRTLIAMLEEVVPIHHCVAPVYCFMPDHLHVILTGRDARANAKVAMDHFKHLSGNWFVDNASEFRWQKNFYDHIVRNREDLVAQVRYVFANPIRGGLIREDEDYPYRGSIGVDFAEYLLDLEMDRKFGGRF